MVKSKVAHGVYTFALIYLESLLKDSLHANGR